ncbi:hypothetical protein J3F83DRAFT_289293 [Trichoderma novae-zelandiae]
MSQQTPDEPPSGNIKTCGLLRVPPEILDRITWHLTTPEYCNLRLTCKSVEQALYFKFTAEFFTRRQFMVSEFSLKALRDISKSRMAGCLRHVHIGLDQLTPASSVGGMGPADPIHMLQLRLIEQETLWTLGLVPKYLAEAFAHLPRLETVAVRDFNSNKRSRDGPFSHWLSYGTQTLVNETQMRPRTLIVHNWDNSGQSEYATRLFKAIIHALAMAQASPTAIEVMERQGNLLYDAAFYIHPEFEAAVAPVLGRVKRLHLCLDTVSSTLSASHHNSQPFHHVHLAKFLRYCEDLEELRINGKHNYFSRGGRSTLHHLFDWLANTTQTEALPSSSAAGDASAPITCDSALLGSGSVPPHARLARLKNISLGMTTFAVDELARLVARFADTLESLELWRVLLLSDDRANDDTLMETRFILYARLLRKLLDMPNLNLRHIKLGNLHQTLYPAGKDVLMQEVSFKPAASTRDVDLIGGLERTTNALAYTGSDWRHFVSHEMIPRLYTPPLQIHAETDMDMDVEEDEDDDEDGSEDGDGDDDE